MSFTVIGNKPAQGPTAEGQYCVAIGTGAIIDEHAYGEILIATIRKASLRLLVDGTISVCGETLGVDREVYQYMRSLVGIPLPDLPNIPEVGYIFKGIDYTPEELDELQGTFKRLSQTVAIGYLAAPQESCEIVFRNRYGYVFRIKPDKTVWAGKSPKLIKKGEIIGCLRELFCIDNPTAIENARQEIMAENTKQQEALLNLVSKMDAAGGRKDGPLSIGEITGIMKASGFTHSESGDLWRHPNGASITGIEVACATTTEDIVALIKHKLELVVFKVTK